MAGEPSKPALLANARFIELDFFVRPTKDLSRWSGIPLSLGVSGISAVDDDAAVLMSPGWVALGRTPCPLDGAR